MEKLRRVIIVALFLTLVETTCGRPSSSTPTVLQQGYSKVEIRNLTMDVLRGVDLKNINQDLNFLKISESDIGEIDKFAFDNFKHLNLLDLSNSHIKSEINSETFFRLPGLEILVLKNLGFETINLNLKNVQELVLSENYLETLGVCSIKGENIYYLDLSDNRLETLSMGFQALNKLSALNLSKNRISHISVDTFKNNTNLLRIMASENKITSTQGFVFPWVKSLDLSANRIEALDSKSFFQMKSLEELVLDFNRIKTLDDSFKDLLELKILNLAWNRIENLPPDLFRNNLYLAKLSLQGNKLKILPRFPSVLYHLSRLDLSHNELLVIDNNFFVSAPNIIFLDLSFNKLKTLSQSLELLTSLKILNLAYNNIALHGFEFSGNMELTHLNLSSNSLSLNLNYFRKNTFLKTLDLSRNKISQFCVFNVTLPNLLKLNLQDNQIRSLSCLTSNDFELLCEVDVRKNPLDCGKSLDYFLLTMASRRNSPFKTSQSLEPDPNFTQCEILSLNKSLELWNSVKQKLCPEETDLREVGEETKEWRKTEKEVDEVADKENVTRVTFPAKEKMSRFVELVAVTEEGSQSERRSWEKLEEIPELLETLEQDEKDDEKRNKEEQLGSDLNARYTITSILVGVFLTIVFFKLAVFAFFFIRGKFWKKTDTITSQKYIVLQNEVYKKTTVPSLITISGEEEILMEDKIKNKIPLRERMEEFCRKFVYLKKEKNPESDKKNLITS